MDGEENMRKIMREKVNFKSIENKNLCKVASTYLP
jgi:hypothetical protein